MAIVSNRVAFWDGDNFVIVSKNCTKEEAKKILMALAAADMDDIQETTPSSAEPVEEPEEVIPVIPDVLQQELHEMSAPETVFPSGKYKGLTPSQVLDQYGAAGFGNLSFLSPKIRQKDESFADEIDKCLHENFRAIFNTDDPKKYASALSEQEADDFLKYYGGILSEKDKADIAGQAGAASYDDLLKDAALKIKRGIIAVAIRKYG